MRIILLLIFVTIPLIASAQWKIGISAGPSLNFLEYQQQDWDYQKCVFGFSAGAFGQYNFRDYLGLRAEINWIQKNNYKNYALYRSDTGYKTTNNYFQIPMIAVGALKLGRFNIFLNVGVYGGYWLSSSVSSDLEIWGDNGINGDYDNRFDFGFVTGLGVDYLISKKISIQFETRLYYSTVSEKKELNGIINPRYNDTLVFQSSLCYSF